MAVLFALRISPPGTVCGLANASSCPEKPAQPSSFRGTPLRGKADPIRKKFSGLPPKKLKAWFRVSNNQTRTVSQNETKTIQTGRSLFGQFISPNERSAHDVVEYLCIIFLFHGTHCRSNDCEVTKELLNLVHCPVCSVVNYFGVYTNWKYLTVFPGMKELASSLTNRTSAPL